MRLRLALIALLLGGAPAIALTEPPAPGPLAAGMIESYLLPRYETFRGATAEQAKAWQEACRDEDFAADLPVLRERFQTAADGWAAVEHVTIGPASVGLRADRIYFGPDRRNAVAKALGELEAKAKGGDLAADAVERVSVAGQGFPALERLLYETDQASPQARCRVGVALARNLATIADEILAGWRAPDGPLARLKRGEGDPVHFADPAQAAARLMTDLAGGFQRVNDMKLFPMLGSSPDMARPKAAEGWRSGHSARAIRVAVGSLAAQARIFSAAAPKDVAAADDKDFAAAEAAVARLPDDLGEAAADPKRRPAIEAAIAALKAAQNDLAKNLAPALGIPLGFNALDGD